MNRSRAMLGVVGGEPRSEVMTVTPEMAAAWLRKNTESNRPVRDSKVTAYARDMQAGRWQLTHQGLAFNRAGELVDGQHRLHAVVRSGCSVKLLVSTGFDVEFNSPIDVGATRRPSDILSQSNQVIATVRCLHVLTNGGTNARGGITVGELEETLGRHQEEVEWVTQAILDRRSKATGIRLSGWVAGAIAFAWPLNRDLVSGFAEQVRTGELLEREDPAYALRAWLARGYKVSSVDIALATCNALRYALARDRVQKIYTGSTGYRWVCTKRRASGIPNTPSADIVESIASPEPAAERRARTAALAARKKSP